MSLPIDRNTADTSTWRYVGHLLPDHAACDSEPIDVLERNEKGQLVRSETQYMGNGEFYAKQGEAVYWCYCRPIPTEYLSEAEASADLDVCGYAGKWKSAKATYEAQLVAGDLRSADYWLKVRLAFLELGGCYFSERKQPLPADYVPPRPLPVIPVMPYHEPQKVRQG